MKIDADGSFSDGLRMNVLPQAIAVANIHIGTIAGKLNGRDARDDPQRLADLVHVDACARLFAEAALEQVGHAAGELEVLEPAGDLAERVRRDLAVLGGEERRERVAPLRRPGSGSGRGCRSACCSDVERQPGNAARAAATAASISSAEAKSTCLWTCPAAGS